MDWIRQTWNELKQSRELLCCRKCGRLLLPGEQCFCIRCMLGFGRSPFIADPLHGSLLTARLGYPFVKGISFFSYYPTDQMRDLIKGIKNSGDIELAHWLGTYVAREVGGLDDEFNHFDYLLPVPLTPDRLRKRGYNQAVWIAEGMQQVWHIPIDVTSVTRSYTSSAQKENVHEDRWTNARTIFTADPHCPLVGKRVLLVDDVITSGATLSACAQAVSKLPGTYISFVTLAST